MNGSAPRQNPGRTALAALLAGAFLLGSSPILVRLSELEPTATAFHRAFLALPVLWLWCRIEARVAPGGGRPAAARDFAGLALAGVFFAGDLAFWHWSLRFTTVANATLLATSAPIFVTLGGFLFFGERFSRTFLLGMALAIAGAAMLIGGSFALSPGNTLGDGLGVVTAVFFASYLLAVGRLRTRFSAAIIMFWSTATTAAVLLPVTLIAGEDLIPTSARGWGVLLGLALLTHAAGQGLVAYALAHLRAAMSAVAILVEPAVATALAWALFGEALGPWQVVGAAVIMSGILLARRGSR